MSGTSVETTASSSLDAVASRSGITLSTLALAWCLRRPGIAAVLTGATSTEQIVANAQAAELELEPELVEEIEAALSPEPRASASISNSSSVASREILGSGISCN